GAEVPKTRPCIVVSRTEANDISSTVTIVPLRRYEDERRTVWCNPPRKLIYLRIQELFATRSEPSIKDVSEKPSACWVTSCWERSIVVSYCIWSSKIKWTYSANTSFPIHETRSPNKALFRFILYPFALM